MKRRRRKSSRSRPARHRSGPPRQPDRPRWPRIAGTIGAFLLVGLLAWLFLPWDPYALPGGDWRLFKKRFLAADGRVVDDGNAGISHTEGQGYGMLLAVAFHDRAAFDSMWTWTQAHLQRKEDFLFSWKWSPEKGGSVGDVNNATDGDLLLAWALERASREWNDYQYKKAAGQIVIAFLGKTTAETYLGLQIMPGLAGFQKPDGLVVNPSYCVFPAFTELASTFPSDKWKPLRAGSIAMLQTAQFGKWKLAPDWVLVGTDWVMLAPDHEEVFGYNAIRVPLHIAWDDPSSPLLVNFAKFWESAPAEKWDPGSVNLKTDAFGPYAALPGMVAVRELTLACVKKTKLTVRDIPRLDTEESYYSASLKLLTKVAIRERFAPKRN